jgi:hypothetical protein
VHNVDDAENFSCLLNDISAFPFENFLQSLKKMNTNGSIPAVQIAKTLSEQVSNVDFDCAHQQMVYAWKVAANMRDYCSFLSSGHIALVQQQTFEDMYICDLVKVWQGWKLFLRTL